MASITVVRTLSVEVEVVELGEHLLGSVWLCDVQQVTQSLSEGDANSGVTIL